MNQGGALTTHKNLLVPRKVQFQNCKKPACSDRKLVRTGSCESDFSFWAGGSTQIQPNTVLLEHTDMLKDCPCYLEQFLQAFWSQVVDERQLTCIDELHLKERNSGTFNPSPGHYRLFSIHSSRDPL